MNRHDRSSCLKNIFISFRDHAFSHICRLNYIQSLHASQPQSNLQLDQSSTSLKPHHSSQHLKIQIKAHLFASAELIEKRSSAGNLSSSETIKARIVAVIHPVVDRINAAAGARVLADGATRRSSLLGRSVGDGVAGGRAAALEDVVEAEVVADFVDGGGALVEARGGAAGDGVGEVDAAVEEEVGGGGVGDGEVAPGWVVSILVEN
jgi:hypothetical protein